MIEGHPQQTTTMLRTVQSVSTTVSTRNKTIQRIALQMSLHNSHEMWLELIHELRKLSSGLPQTADICEQYLELPFIAYTDGVRVQRSRFSSHCVTTGSRKI
jgi:hypothetical protein